MTSRSASGRYRFDADDPHRPTVSGYTTSGRTSLTRRSSASSDEDSDQDNTIHKRTQSDISSVNGVSPKTEIPRPVDTTTSQISATRSRDQNMGPATPTVTSDQTIYPTVHTLPTTTQPMSPTAASNLHTTPPNNMPLPTPQTFPSFALPTRSGTVDPNVTSPQQAYSVVQNTPKSSEPEKEPIKDIPAQDSALMEMQSVLHPTTTGKVVQPTTSSQQNSHTHDDAAHSDSQSTQQANLQSAQPTLNAQQSSQKTNNQQLQTINNDDNQQAMPPLPDGWIANLDQNSGHYYYIHLASQSTQWEFPKDVTPLAFKEGKSNGESLSPMKSPSIATATPHSIQAPISAHDEHSSHLRSSVPIPPGFASNITGPFTVPPSPGAQSAMSGIMPSNHAYFGPYLRYTNIDLERCLWLGSVVLVTDLTHPPTLHIHQTTDLSPNPRQLRANPIYDHRGWIFYRYDMDLLMEEHATKWTYAITSHLGCTRNEFVVAGRYETSWRFISHSSNDFCPSVSEKEQNKLGGAGLMWKDVLQKHQECGGFHVQLGLGGQIYADALFEEISALQEWSTINTKEKRRTTPWNEDLEDDVTHAYFQFYTTHFDQPYLRDALACIPHVFALDDHDIFDGWGSYPEYLQHSHIFRNIGRIGIDMYLLFQHHTTQEILQNVTNDLDLFTITGTGWHFLKYLGPAVVVVGPDTRSERTNTQVMAGPTYQGLFPKVAMLPPCVQHCIWIFPVPLIFPRLHSADRLATTVSHSKSAVTETFNKLGKVKTSLPGLVNEGLNSIKKAIGKSGLMTGMMSPFGEVDVFDELRDMWTHESKDLERTYIIRTLQGVSHNKSLRMTFLSGSVNCAGAGLVYDPSHPSDHKTMFQLISSAIVNAPPTSTVLRMLNTDPKQSLYIPPNGRKSIYNTGQSMPHTDTKEDMMEIFVADPDGKPREMKRLMGRRNYIVMVAYDPELVQDSRTNGKGSQTSSPPPLGYTGGKGSGRLSLAADFLVQQSNQGHAGSVKYGPVVIPCLEYGR